MSSSPTSPEADLRRVLFLCTGNAARRTWAAIRKIVDASESVRGAAFKSQEYAIG